jgi:hypothetical protein
VGGKMNDQVVYVSDSERKLQNEMERTFLRLGWSERVKTEEKEADPAENAA